MKGNERIEKFLELQNKNMEFEDISKEIGVTTKALKAFLNRRGYKLENGKYKLKENDKIKQIEFQDINKDKKDSTKTKKNSTKVKTKKIINNNLESEISIKEKKKSSVKSKKDRKINITEQDMDKLCEVYDWYMQVKDYKCMKPKKTSSKKDINIDKRDLKDLKSASIRVDKKTWEDFERLCSNSQFSKQEIITQALKDFMNEYKNLL